MLSEYTVEVERTYLVTATVKAICGEQAVREAQKVAEKAHGRLVETRARIIGQDDMGK